MSDAILLDIEAGDEVIVPTFTFPSTANAFVLRGVSLMSGGACHAGTSAPAT